VKEFLSKPVGALPVPIVPPLPEVYQIEVTNTCNYECIMCPMQFFKRKDDRKFLEIDLLRKIISQGDLDASYFVEFQISGEPLLHPHLKRIIQMVKETDVMTGLSTNGVFIPDQMEALLELNVITVSVDSLLHHDDIRKSKAVDAYPTESLIRNIKNLLVRAEDRGIAVDLQIIELDGWEAALEDVKREFEGYTCNIRTNPNCYHAFIHPDIPTPVSHDLCINPWFSASIMCNGNVTPCCISQGDDIIYGNLYDQTLREVWAGEPIKKFREQMQTRDYPEVCSKCYMRSPALFHWNMYQSEMKKRYKNHRIM
jgi:radical SAM protein with 4Fe4S-binding SPASM domain